jgi:hypothetical protein
MVEVIADFSSGRPSLRHITRGDGFPVDERPHAPLSRSAGPRSTFVAELLAGSPDTGESRGTRLAILVAGTCTPHIDNLW